MQVNLTYLQTTRQAQGYIKDQEEFPPSYLSFRKALLTILPENLRINDLLDANDHHNRNIR